MTTTRNKTPYRTLFAAASLLTELFPETGARFLNASVSGLLGNRFLLRSYLRKNLRQLPGGREFRRILVIGDLNIGDAVTLQASIAALRDFFPEAKIDYCTNRYARTLIEGNHEISRLWPIFTGTYFPDRSDFARVKEIVAWNDYDLVINFCPLFNERRLPASCPAIGYSALAAQLIRDEHHGQAVNQIVFKAHRFIYDLLAAYRPQRPRPFRGVSIFLSDSAVQRATEFLQRNDLSEKTLLFYNPDASSEFTRIPFDYQLLLLRNILEETGATVLVGAGHTAKDIGKRLLHLLPLSLSSRAVLVPSSLPLDSYAALIDRSAVFVTADTGPLHIAAARKVSRSGEHPFRNRTAVVSIFGATPARIYGYDSRQPGYFAANQGAPSFSYTAASRCRNITCINKMAKTCGSVRCFERLEIGPVVADIRRCLDAAADACPRRPGAGNILAVND